jgi:hypothetical protein
VEAVAQRVAGLDLAGDTGKGGELGCEQGGGNEEDNRQRHEAGAEAREPAQEAACEAAGKEIQKDWVQGRYLLPVVRRVVNCLTGIAGHDYYSR